MKSKKDLLLAKNIIDYSVNIKTGDNVLIEIIGLEGVGLGKCLQEEIAKRGAKAYFNIIDYGMLKNMIQDMTEEQVKMYAKHELTRMKDMDVYICIASPIYPSIFSNIDSAKMNLYNYYYLKPVQIDNRAKKDRWCILKYPNKSMAEHYEMEENEFQDFFYKVCNMDYSKLSEKMDSLVHLMNKTDKVHIISDDTDLTFSIKGILAQKYDGRYNLPDGEIASAPIKESVNGYITFNTESVYNGIEFKNIKLEFKDGKVVKASCNKSKELNEILDIDGGARYLGEFAFGFNPNICKVYKDILFDEKIAGSIHLALGETFETPGNENKSAIHWDIVKMMKKENGGGKIYFDDKLVQKDGKFVI